MNIALTTVITSKGMFVYTIVIATYAVKFTGIAEHKKNATFFGKK